MSKQEIILIVITALTGAFAKELVAWLLRILKVPVTVRIWKYLINPFVLELLYDLGLSVLALRYLLKQLNGPPAVVRSDVFAICFSLVFMAAAVYLIIKTLVSGLEGYLRNKNAELQLKIESQREQLAELDTKLAAMAGTRAELEKQVEDRSRV